MLKVAIVDDEIWVCRLIQKLIEWDDLELCLAFVENDAEVALNRIITEQPDIVITDIRMPDMDGISLLKNLNKLDTMPEIIILSGYPDFDYAQKVMELGASFYLLKPVEQVELNKALASIKYRLYKKSLNEETQEITKKNLEDNVYSLRDFFFSKITSGEKIDDNVLRITLEKKVFFQKYNNYIVVIAKVFSNKINPYANQGTLGLKLDTCLNNTEHNDSMVFFSHLYENKCLYLINYSDDLKTKINDIITESYYHYYNTVDHTKYKVLFGISQSYNDKFLTQQYYDQAYAALSLFLFEQKEKLYTYDDFKQLGELPSILTAQREKSILLYAEVLNVSGLTQELNQIFDDLDITKYESPHLVIKTTYKISELIFDVLKDVDVDIYEKEKTNYKNVVENLDNLKDIKNFSITFFEGIITNLYKNRNQNSSGLIVKAKEYISKNYYKKLSLTDVAEVLYLNPKYFSNLFKKETGINFVEYVNSVRIDIAKSLLKENKYSISQVAYKVGFTDPKHFSRLFKKQSGVTPKEYKQYHI